MYFAYPCIGFAKNMLSQYATRIYTIACNVRNLCKQKKVTFLTKSQSHVPTTSQSAKKTEVVHQPAPGKPYNEPTITVNG